VASAPRGGTTPAVRPATTGPGSRGTAAGPLPPAGGAGRPAAPAVAFVPPAHAAAGGTLPASLNDRLKAALPTGAVTVNGMKRYDLGGYQTDRVIDAYEASLAPPLEILLKTFGLIYTKRTEAQADSIAYVYERTRILGVEVCRAYTIVEHPLRGTGPNADHIGPVGPPVSGRGSAIGAPGPLPDLKPEVSTDIVPCNAKGMIPVVPGSMTSPAPRHPDLATPSPAP
jgi:hypothetical protein